mmetsp:Transcript_16105/g.39246  ORF Transcript_16105/g.39246 Transcript_16105/m.39246 type:complete len:1234 (+) Transcript_16105:1156-4857(+)
MLLADALLDVLGGLEHVGPHLGHDEHRVDDDGADDEEAVAPRQQLHEAGGRLAGQKDEPREDVDEADEDGAGLHAVQAPVLLRVREEVDGHGDEQRGQAPHGLPQTSHRPGRAEQHGGRHDAQLPQQHHDLVEVPRGAVPHVQEPEVLHGLRALQLVAHLVQHGAEQHDDAERVHDHEDARQGEVPGVQRVLAALGGEVEAPDGGLRVQVVDPAGRVLDAVEVLQRGLGQEDVGDVQQREHGAEHEQRRLPDVVLGGLGGHALEEHRAVVAVVRAQHLRPAVHLLGVVHGLPQPLLGDDLLHHGRDEVPEGRLDDDEGHEEAGDDHGRQHDGEVAREEAELGHVALGLQQLQVEVERAEPLHDGGHRARPVELQVREDRRDLEEDEADGDGLEAAHELGQHGQAHDEHDDEEHHEEVHPEVGAGALLAVAAVAVPPLLALGAPQQLVARGALRAPRPHVVHDHLHRGPPRTRLAREARAQDGRRGGRGDVQEVARHGQRDQLPPVVASRVRAQRRARLAQLPRVPVVPWVAQAFTQEPRALGGGGVRLARQALGLPHAGLVGHHAAGGALRVRFTGRHGARLARGALRGVRHGGGGAQGARPAVLGLSQVGDADGAQQHAPEPLAVPRAARHVDVQLHHHAGVELRAVVDQPEPKRLQRGAALEHGGAVEQRHVAAGRDREVGAVARGGGRRHGGQQVHLEVGDHREGGEDGAAHPRASQELDGQHGALGVRPLHHHRHEPHVHGGAGLAHGHPQQLGLGDEHGRVVDGRHLELHLHVVAPEGLHQALEYPHEEVHAVRARDVGVWHVRHVRVPPRARGEVLRRAPLPPAGLPRSARRGGHHRQVHVAVARVPVRHLPGAGGLLALVVEALERQRGVLDLHGAGQGVHHGVQGQLLGHVHAEVRLHRGQRRRGARAVDAHHRRGVLVRAVGGGGRQHVRQVRGVVDAHHSLADVGQRPRALHVGHRRVVVPAARPVVHHELEVVRQSAVVAEGHVDEGAVVGAATARVGPRAQQPHLAAPGLARDGVPQRVPVAVALRPQAVLQVVVRPELRVHGDLVIAPRLELVGEHVLGEVQLQAPIGRHRRVVHGHHLHGPHVHVVVHLDAEDIVLLVAQRVLARPRPRDRGVVHNPVYDVGLRVRQLGRAQQLVAGGPQRLEVELTGDIFVGHKLVVHRGAGGLRVRPGEAAQQQQQQRRCQDQPLRRRRHSRHCLNRDWKNHFDGLFGRVSFFGGAG